MKRSWTRPYRPGPFRFLMLTFLLVGSAGLAVVTVAILRGSGDKLLSLAVIWGLMLVWLGFAWRVYRMGVYVSDDGVRVVKLLRTVGLDWEDVRRFYLAPFRVPIVGGWPTQATAVWLRPVDGPAIQTPLNDQSAEFLGRQRAFHRAFEALCAWQADESASGLNVDR